MLALSKKLLTVLNWEKILFGNVIFLPTEMDLFFISTLFDNVKTYIILGIPLRGLRYV